MPIAALPTTAVSAIGSCQALTDSCSLVKELVDNALDADATSISIEISPNALDVLQVKDNGTGIRIDDFDMVCRRNCTSKITSLEDLRKLGGSLLGFRGQALESAVEMSGGLRLTTKTDKDAVAKAVEFGRTGDILSSENTSHPTGTTVRIKDFLKNIPVRRQTELKTTSRTIAKIKKTLQAYAIARPTTRLSFKILRSPSDNGNWAYSPSPNAEMAEAALTVFGREIAGQCLKSFWRSADDISIIGGSQSSLCSTQQDPTTYEITALLPTHESDLQKIYGKGQFISVDGRPVSASRGTFRDVVRLYKSYIRHHSDPSKSSSDPFLCMSIKCSPGSYDPNVEPAKDDVLFVDPKKLLSLAEDLFKSVYGNFKEHATPRAPQSASEKITSLQNIGFDILLARRSPRETSIEREPKSSRIAAVNSTEGSEDPSDTIETESAIVESSMAPAMQHNDQENCVAEDDHISVPVGLRGMYSTDDDEMLLVDMLPHSLEDEVEDDPAELRSSRINNPWTIAKMNATIRPAVIRSTNDHDGNTQLPTPAREPHRPFNLSLISNHTSQSPLHTATSNSSSPSSQSPPPSPQTYPQKAFGPPRRPWNSEVSTKSNNDALKAAGHIYEGVGFATTNRGSSKSGGSAGSLDADDGSQISSQESIISTNDNGPQGSQEGLFMGRSLSDQGRKRFSLPKPSSLNRPFKSPMKQAKDRGIAQPPQTFVQRAMPSSTEPTPPPPTRFNPINLADLEAVMEFEQRKKAAQEQLKQSRSQKDRRNATLSHTSALSRSPPIRIAEGSADDIETPTSTPPSTMENSPHHNRYLVAKAALSSQSADIDNSPIFSDRTGPQMLRPALHPKDPRAYLIKHNAALASAPPQSRLKIRRGKTCLLPLETIPAKSQTYNLCTTIRSSSHSTPSLIETAVKSLNFIGANDVKFPGLSQSSLGDCVVDLKWEPWDRNGLIQQCHIDIQSIESEADVELAKALREHFLRHEV